MKNSSRDTILWSKRTKRHEARKHKFYDPKKLPKKKVLGYTCVDAPALLDIYSEDTYKETLSFVDDLLHESSRSKVMIDFSETKKVTAAALLFLYARLDNHRIKNTKSKVRIRTASLNGQVRRAVQVSGLIKLTLNREQLNSFEHRYSLPVTRGTAEGEEFESVIDHILTKIYKTSDPEVERVIGAAVSETVGNVKLHAYPEVTQKSLRHWWLMCSVFDDSLYLAIYDQGVGIPNTIHSTGWIRDIIKKSPKLLQRMGSSRDADLIELSMELGRSQTKQKKHGKGSKSIRALVEETPNGQLWMFSNNGLLKESNSEGRTLVEHNESIGGTLVQWNIRLKDEKKIEKN